jgi:hypothetical protein
MGIELEPKKKKEKKKMNKTFLAAMLSLAALAAAHAANPMPARGESGSDAVRSHRKGVHHPNMLEAASSPTNADVGDGDSFGRSVNHLGFTVVEGVQIWHDCTDRVPERCMVPSGETPGGFLEYIGDDAVIKLPARAARSLLCFNLTNFGIIQFTNPGPMKQTGSATLMATWRLESEVLQDPTLINPNTGLPFDGSLTNAAFLAQEWQILHPGDGLPVVPTHSRGCVAGHLSRRGLIDMGLSEAQAREVFRRPITLRFGARVQASHAYAVSSYGVRIYGD